MEPETKEDPEEWPELTVPPGQTDVFCKFCRRSKYTTRNTVVGLQQAVETNAVTLRWRRERGNLCAPCHGYQARRDTPDEFRTAAVSCRVGVLLATVFFLHIYFELAVN